MKRVIICLLSVILSLSSISYKLIAEDTTIYIDKGGVSITDNASEKELVVEFTDSQGNVKTSEYLYDDVITISQLDSTNETNNNIRVALSKKDARVNIVLDSINVHTAYGDTAIQITGSNIQNNTNVVTIFSKGNNKIQVGDFYTAQNLPAEHKNNIGIHYIDNAEKGKLYIKSIDNGDLEIIAGDINTDNSDQNCNRAIFSNGPMTIEEANLKLLVGNMPYLAYANSNVIYSWYEVLIKNSNVKCYSGDGNAVGGIIRSYDEGVTIVDSDIEIYGDVNDAAGYGTHNSFRTNYPNMPVNCYGISTDNGDISVTNSNLNIDLVDSRFNVIGMISWAGKIDIDNSEINIKAAGAQYNSAAGIVLCGDNNDGLNDLKIKNNSNVNIYTGYSATDPSTIYSGSSIGISEVNDLYIEDSNVNIQTSEATYEYGIAYYNSVVFTGTTNSSIKTNKDNTNYNYAFAKYNGESPAFETGSFFIYENEYITEAKTFEKFNDDILDSIIIQNPGIKEISDQQWTGDSVEPNVEVYYKNDKLTKGSDYTVTYENNIDVGTGKAVVTLKGNYSGNISREFKILDSVAKIDDIYYGTIQNAVTKAKNGDVIEVIKNCDIPEQIIVDKKITLDISTYTVSAAKDAFLIQGGDLRITGTGILKMNQTSGYYGIQLKGSTDPKDEDYSNITIDENVTVKGTGYGISISNNNGCAYGVNVNVYGRVESAYGMTISGTINKTIGNVPNIHFYPGSYNNGFYAGGYAKWILEGDQEAVLDSEHPNDPVSGISIKCGDFVINGGTYTGKGVFTSNPETYNNGSEETGAAVSITTNSTYSTKTKIVINDGVFISESGVALFEGIATNDGTPTGTKAASESNVDITINGGEFISANGYEALMIKEAKNKNVVYGGYFSTSVSGYVAPGYKRIETTQTEKNNHNNLGYTIGHIDKDDSHAIEIETDNNIPEFYSEVKDLQDAIDNVKEANEQKTNNGDNVTQSTIIVNNSSSGIEAEIDDTIKIVAKTNSENKVEADPGYKLDDPVNNPQNGTTTYTATALKIGVNVNGGSGSGKVDIEKDDAGYKDDIGSSSGVQKSTSGLDDVSVAGSVQLGNIVKQKEDAILQENGINQGTAAKALNKAGIKVSTSGSSDSVKASDVNIFIITYYEKEILEDKTNETEKSFKLEVTPMYQIFASSASGIDSATDENSVPMSDAKEVDCTGKVITFKLELPSGFITNVNQKVYVVHTLKNETKKTYDTRITENDGKFYAEFDNPDGFSSFEFVLKKPVSSYIGKKYSYVNTGIK